MRAVDLVRRHGGRAVVDGASLSLAAGELLCITGPSGCGKTTLLQLLGLLDAPDAGRVWLDGQDLYALRPAARAALRLAHIGVVFQQHNLIDALDLRHNVALPGWRLTGDRRRALSRADELLARLGLGDRAADPAGQLSMGEAQRGAIARALCNQPRVLLADEPTGSLDSRAAAAVMDALAEAARQGAAVLVVTHDPLVVARAQRVLRMRDGRLGPTDPTDPTGPTDPTNGAA